MNKISIILAGVLLVAVMPAPVSLGGEDIHKEAPSTIDSTSGGVIEKSFTKRGTKYVLRVNLSNHTLRVRADHFAENQTNAGYAIYLNGKQLTNQRWVISKGETKQYQTSLFHEYYAGDILRNITLYTKEELVSVTYNFTVPRKHDGRYLRPTVTDVEFEQINRTHGRVIVTARSDTKYRYPAYARIWAPGVDAKILYLHSGAGDNKTTESLIMPVRRGEDFEGEIWVHATGLNETGPLHAKWEFYGRPGNAQFSRVPFEPMRLERVSEYTYVNDSASDSGGFGMNDGDFRRVLGGLGVVLLLVVVVGVLLGRRRREV
ncbi:hypothetical protein [Halorubellus sp. PRR65]|uniref:hypothetical protein n=1 Tax=Halorubellus sp. PRR65 TaxID=3098148 RepID=UPI002B25E227|nr:hypothetical protein [Halorubellus sp. PRR65]